jgi:hypothetical protein
MFDNNISRSYIDSVESELIPLDVDVAAVIGDLVGSRRQRDQDGLFASIRDTLKEVNAEIRAIQPLQMTIGDEFQAVYATLAEALDACLMVRLRLAGTCDVRFGIGWGEISAYDPELAPMAQSGAAWWNARDALDEVSAAVSRRGWPRGLRTWVRGLESRTEATLNAWLLCRDELLSAMDDRASYITLGLMMGHRQRDIADGLSITQPAVAKRLKESGANAIFRAHQLFRGVRP